MASSSSVTSNTTLSSVNITHGMSTVPSLSSVSGVNERTGEGAQRSKVEGCKGYIGEKNRNSTDEGFHDRTDEESQVGFVFFLFQQIKLCI